MPTAAKKAKAAKAAKADEKPQADQAEQQQPQGPEAAPDEAAPQPAAPEADQAAAPAPEGAPINRDSKGQPPPTNLLERFFGPECEAEIAEDGSMTRGAEKFMALAEDADAPGQGWIPLADRDGAVLWRLLV